MWKINQYLTDVDEGYHVLERQENSGGRGGEGGGGRGKELLS